MPTAISQCCAALTTDPAVYLGFSGVAATVTGVPLSVFWATALPGNSLQHEQRAFLRYP